MPWTITAAAAPADTEPPADAVSLVLAQLDGDVSTLCASACVCKRWHAVLSLAERQSELLWRVLRVPRRVAPRLTDALLASLVARARGELQSLDVSGCIRLTDAGLKVALASQSTKLAHFAAVGCYNLSSVGVARALKGRELDVLLVRGVATGCVAFAPAGDKPVGNPAAQMVAREVQQLRRRLSRPKGHLDARAGCTYVQEADQFVQQQEMCGCLCGEDDRSCDCCSTAYRCIMHGSPAEMVPDVGDGVERCMRCKGRMCASCMAFEPANKAFTKTCGHCLARLCPSCIAAPWSKPLPKCAGDDCRFKGACEACIEDKSFPMVYVANPAYGTRYYLCGSEACSRSHAQRRAKQL